MQPSSEDLTGRIQRLVVEYRALPVVDARTDEELLGYDDVGLPQ